VHELPQFIADAADLLAQAIDEHARTRAPDRGPRCLPSGPGRVWRDGTHMVSSRRSAARPSGPFPESCTRNLDLLNQWDGP
jgi:hypothetical protein